MAATSETKCAFHGCAAVTPGYKYCRPHNAWIRAQALCYDCLQPKEQPEHRICAGCFLLDKMRRREQAIEAGLCTNYWKCKAPATRKGGMCADCFHEFMKARGQWVVVKPVQSAPTPAPQTQTPLPSETSFPQTIGKGKKATTTTCWAGVSEKVMAKPEPVRPPTPVTPKKSPVASPKGPTPVKAPTPVWPKAPTPVSPKKSPATSPLKSKPSAVLEEAVEMAMVPIVKSLF